MEPSEPLHHEKNIASTPNSHTAKSFKATSTWKEKNREMGDKKLPVHKRYFRHTKNIALPRLNHLLFKKRLTAKKSQQAVDLI